MPFKRFGTLLDMQGVGGSSPLSPTSLNSRKSLENITVFGFFAVISSVPAVHGKRVRSGDVWGNFPKQRTKQIQSIKRAQPGEPTLFPFSSVFLGTRVAVGGRCEVLRLRVGATTWSDANRCRTGRRRSGARRRSHCGSQN